MTTFEPVEIAGTVHDNRYCADSAYAAVKDFERWEGYNTGCHDGEVYGPCGAESCYGQCVSLRYCTCVCHQEPA